MLPHSKIEWKIAQHIMERRCFIWPTTNSCLYSWTGLHGSLTTSRQQERQQKKFFHRKIQFYKFITAGSTTFLLHIHSNPSYSSAFMPPSNAVSTEVLCSFSNCLDKLFSSSLPKWESPVQIQVCLFACLFFFFFNTMA